MDLATFLAHSRTPAIIMVWGAKEDLQNSPYVIMGQALLQFPCLCLGGKEGKKESFFTETKLLPLFGSFHYLGWGRVYIGRCIESANFPSFNISASGHSLTLKNRAELVEGTQKEGGKNTQIGSHLLEYAIIPNTLSSYKDSLESHPYNYFQLYTALPTW